MIHTCDAFPPRHNDPHVISDVAAYWFERGWYLRQPHGGTFNGWNLSGEFYLTSVTNGIVGRHFWGYEDLMDGTNEVLKYGKIL